MYLASYRAFNPHATWLDNLIGIVSLGKYSHSELVFSDGVCFSISPRDNKGRFKHIDLSGTQWDLLPLSISFEEEVVIKRLCNAYIDIPYDYIGALTAPLRLCLHSTQHIFCSEVCAKVLLNLPRYSYLGRACGYTPARLKKDVIWSD